MWKTAGGGGEKYGDNWERGGEKYGDNWERNMGTTGREKCGVGRDSVVAAVARETNTLYQQKMRESVR